MKRLRKRSPPPDGTLVVIDVQTGYLDAAEAIRYPVRLEILRAMKQGWGIVFVQMNKMGKTLPELLREVTSRKYTRYYAPVTKELADGSAQVIAACERLGYSKRLIRVCGLRSNICVQDTVEGLSKKLPDARIEVKQTACFPAPRGHNCFAGHFDWSTFPVLPNVVLVRREKECHRPQLDTAV